MGEVAFVGHLVEEVDCGGAAHGVGGGLEVVVGVSESGCVSFLVFGYYRLSRGCLALFLRSRIF